MAKLVTIYESFIETGKETGNLYDVRTRIKTRKSRRARRDVSRTRAVDAAIYGIGEATYEEWPTEELCERARLRGLDGGGH